MNVVCNKDSDCGSDGFVDNAFCEEGNAHKNFNDYTCLNPGTASSSCKLDTTSVVIEDCNGNEICNDGMCVNVVCNKDSDCGSDGFVGDEMCSANDITKNFQDFECHNPGTIESFCTIEVNPKIIDQCEFACIENGICIRCDENSDCDDTNENTNNICLNPGTVNSFCKNEAICNAELMVHFNYIKNKNNGNLEPKVFVGENKIEFGDNEAIPLIEDGKFIEDSDYVEDVPGISLQRMGDGRLRFILFGEHNLGTGKEIMDAKLIFDGAIVTGFENDLTEDHKKLDHQGDGKYELGDPEKDEVYVNDKEVLWFSTVNTHSDGFFLDLECSK